jgi:hypothetical protein
MFWRRNARPWWREVTYYRWRQVFGGLNTEQVKRLKDLEREQRWQVPAESLQLSVGALIVDPIVYLIGLLAVSAFFDGAVRHLTLQNNLPGRIASCQRSIVLVVIAWFGWWRRPRA